MGQRMARGGARDGQGRCACARLGACGAGGGAPPTQVDGPAQGPRCARPRAHAPGTQRPALLRVRRARAHRSLRLRAARDTHRARLFPWQARDGRDRKRRGCGAGGPGLHARARVKPAGASAETWRRARPPPQPSRPPPPPFRCRRVRVRVRVRVSPLRSVFMPNTHTGPGAGRWEGGGVQTSGRYNLIMSRLSVR